MVVDLLLNLLLIGLGLFIFISALHYTKSAHKEMDFTPHFGWSIWDVIGEFIVGGILNILKKLIPWWVFKVLAIITGLWFFFGGIWVLLTQTVL